VPECFRGANDAGSLVIAILLRVKGLALWSLITCASLFTPVGRVLVRFGE